MSCNGQSMCKQCCTAAVLFLLILSCGVKADQDSTSCTFMTYPCSSIPSGGWGASQSIVCDPNTQSYKCDAGADTGKTAFEACPASCNAQPTPSPSPPQPGADSTSCNYNTYPCSSIPRGDWGASQSIVCDPSTQTYKCDAGADAGKTAFEACPASCNAQPTPSPSPQPSADSMSCSFMTYPCSSIPSGGWGASQSIVCDPNTQSYKCDAGADTGKTAFEACPASCNAQPTPSPSPQPGADSMSCSFMTYPCSSIPSGGWGASQSIVCDPNTQSYKCDAGADTGKTAFEACPASCNAQPTPSPSPPQPGAHTSTKPQGMRITLKTALGGFTKATFSEIAQSDYRTTLSVELGSVPPEAIVLKNVRDADETQRVSSQRSLSASSVGVTFDVIISAADEQKATSIKTDLKTRVVSSRFKAALRMILSTRDGFDATKFDAFEIPHYTGTPLVEMAYDSSGSESPNTTSGSESPNTTAEDSSGSGSPGAAVFGASIAGALVAAGAAAFWFKRHSCRTTPSKATAAQGTPQAAGALGAQVAQVIGPTQVMYAMPGQQVAQATGQAVYTMPGQQVAQATGQAVYTMPGQQVVQAAAPGAPTMIVPAQAPPVYSSSTA